MPISRRSLVGGLAASLGLQGRAAGAQSFPVLVHAPREAQGTTAFVDVQASRIVEIDYTGRVTWSWPIPSSLIGSGNLGAGADLKWIAKEQSFLLTIPASGIFQISRAGQVLWSYGTPKVSHDADRLANGNVVHTWGWDERGDDQAVEVDPTGRRVWRWSAQGKVDPSWRDIDVNEWRPSWTHANAVQRLGNGDTLVSLRNMHRVVRVSPAGEIVHVFGPLRGIHEPNLMGGSIVGAVGQRFVVMARPGSRPKRLFEDTVGLAPIRTVKPLGNGVLLVAGGDGIAEVQGGRVIWFVRIYNGAGPRGIYKAARVPARSG